MNVGVLTTFMHNTLQIWVYVFFHLIEQHSKFLLHTLQVLYMCTLCDATNVNTTMKFVLHVSGDGFSGGTDSYLQFRDTHVPCLLKLCIPPSNGIVRWWLFPEFCGELPQGNCTPTIILNNPVHYLLHVPYTVHGPRRIYSMEWERLLRPWLVYSTSKQTESA